MTNALRGNQNHATMPAIDNSTRPAEASHTRAQGSRGNGGPRIRTLHDDTPHSAARRDTMNFYNGNQVGRESGFLFATGLVFNTDKRYS